MDGRGQSPVPCSPANGNPWASKLVRNCRASSSSAAGIGHPSARPWEASTLLAPSRAPRPRRQPDHAVPCVPFPPAKGELPVIPRLVSALPLLDDTIAPARTLCVRAH
jgi:hypothetical protein